MGEGKRGWEDNGGEQRKMYSSIKSIKKKECSCTMPITLVNPPTTTMDCLTNILQYSLCSVIPSMNVIQGSHFLFLQLISMAQSQSSKLQLFLCFVSLQGKQSDWQLLCNSFDSQFSCILLLPQILAQVILVGLRMGQNFKKIKEH